MIAALRKLENQLTSIRISHIYKTNEVQNIDRKHKLINYYNPI